VVSFELGSNNYCVNVAVGRTYRSSAFISFSTSFQRAPASEMFIYV
jgi:hypothetical protein